MRILRTTVHEPRQDVPIVHKAKGLSGRKLTGWTPRYFVDYVVKLTRKENVRQCYPLRTHCGYGLGRRTSMIIMLAYDGKSVAFQTFSPSDAMSGNIVES